MHEYYKVMIGTMEWGSADSLEKAIKIYEDAKEHNSDCFVSLLKITQKTVKHEWIDFKR